MTLPNPKEQEWPVFAENMRGFIKKNTAIAAPPLVPEIKLYLASDVTPIWKATEKFFETNNVPAPFWCFAWPGGQALSRYILDNPKIVRDKCVLDFASGSGIVAFAAKKAGATHVVASDVDPIALLALEMNAELNGVTVECAHANFMNTDLSAFDVILAGDFCYEWPMAGYAVEWLRAEVAKGRLVLFGDPGRPHAPRFGITKLGMYDVPTTKLVEDSDVKHTGVFRLLASEDEG